MGKREAAGNNSTVEGDVIGHSIFAWDTDVEPAYYYSSLRILGFMHCMGTVSYTHLDVYKRQG